MITHSTIPHNLKQYSTCTHSSKEKVRTRFRWQPPTMHSQPIHLVNSKTSPKIYSTSLPTTKRNCKKSKPNCQHNLHSLLSWIPKRSLLRLMCRMEVFKIRGDRISSILIFRVHRNCSTNNSQTSHIHHCHTNTSKLTIQWTWWIRASGSSKHMRSMFHRIFRASHTRKLQVWWCILLIINNRNRIGTRVSMEQPHQQAWSLTELQSDSK